MRSSGNLFSMFQTGAARQLFFMVGVAVSVAMGINLYMSIAEPTYRPLDYQLTQKNMSTIVDILEKSKIDYKINDKDGMILVPASQMEAAKLKLSAAGVPKDSGFTYSYMNEQSSLSNSQFIENARYLLALEDDLAKTISSIEGISGARVHIAMPRNNLFADENNKVTASILVNIAPGLSSNKEIIRSIVQIVASSVPGLDPKYVSITDQYGHVLSDGLDQNSIYSAAQLTYQNNVQSYYEKRIESMLVPILGEYKVVVRVNADIDFTQKEDAEEDFDPKKTALVSEQTDNESNSGGGASGAPGSLSNSPAGGGASGGGSGGGQSRSQSTKNYNVSKTVTYKKNGAPKIKSLSVAVVVDNETEIDPKTKKAVSKPLSQEKITKITDLVKTAMGFDQARGDKVTVINSAYSPRVENIPEVKTQIWNTVWFWDVIKKIIGILLGFTFLFMVYKKLNALMAAGFMSKSSRFEMNDDMANDGNSQMQAAKKQGINQLKELAKNDPEKIAAILKTWVRK